MASIRGTKGSRWTGTGISTTVVVVVSTVAGTASSGASVVVGLIGCVVAGAAGANVVEAPSSVEQPAATRAMRTNGSHSFMPCSSACFRRSLERGVAVDQVFGRQSALLATSGCGNPLAESPLASDHGAMHPTVVGLLPAVAAWSPCGPGREITASPTLCLVGTQPSAFDYE